MTVVAIVVGWLLKLLLDCCSWDILLVLLLPPPPPLRGKCGIPADATSVILMYNVGASKDNISSMYNVMLST